jgi:RHS repeat-associated protein
VKDTQVICVRREQKYFCKEDWTASISLIRFNKLGWARRRILNQKANLVYAAPGSPLPHAVMSISGSTLSTTFTYDPNGNQTGGLGRTMSWTASNRPASITQGTNTISFGYDVDHQRVMQVAPDGTTLYIHAFGVSTELFGAGTPAARWTDYLSVGNAKVGMRVVDVAAETVSTRYFHTDHLGSISVITDENGVVLERLSYDAWGKRRFASGADDPTGSITSQSTRGFTGQEQLDTFALVHLNGRVYDPMVGRMISADPTRWPSPIPRVLQIASTVILTAVLEPLGTLAAGVIASAASAAIVTGLSGGNFGQMLKAGVIAGATAFAFYEVGDLTPGAANAMQNPAAYAENVAGHALVGCASPVASGGSCEPGALSGAVTSAAGPLINNPYSVQSLVANAALGGLASVAGGGKFANGALTGSFGYLFNDLGHMLVGTDAHFQLTAYLQQRDPGLWDESNTTMGGIFSGRPDLIYDSMPRDVFEIKPDGSAASGAAQLQGYLNTPGSQAVAGNFNLIFKGTDAPNVTLSGGWFGEATYTYSASAFPGVVTYSVGSSETFTQARSLFSQTTPSPFPLPPRFPPTVVP